MTDVKLSPTQKSVEQKKMEKHNNNKKLMINKGTKTKLATGRISSLSSCRSVRRYLFIYFTLLMMVVTHFVLYLINRILMMHYEYIISMY